MKTMSITSQGKITEIEVDSLSKSGFYRSDFFSVEITNFKDSGDMSIVQLSEYTGFGAIEKVANIRLQILTDEEKLEMLNRVFSCYGVVIKIKK